ncbi:MAG: hypothetical protein IT424_15580 [Pirellulales bacterium]|nr:hypothetical protein [Pirellulales bacterium]
MTLDLGAQLASAQEAYLDNADYRSTGSLTKAAEFETACRKLLVLLPQSSRQAGRFDIAIDTKLIPRELERVTAWLASQPGAVGSLGGRVRGFDVTHFRE